MPTIHPWCTIERGLAGVSLNPPLFSALIVFLLIFIRVLSFHKNLSFFSWLVSTKSVGTNGIDYCPMISSLSFHVVILYLLYSTGCSSIIVIWRSIMCALKLHCPQRCKVPFTKRLIRHGMYAALNQFSDLLFDPSSKVFSYLIVHHCYPHYHHCILYLFESDAERLP